jgi:hypothetical protein
MGGGEPDHGAEQEIMGQAFAGMALVRPANTF